MAVLLKRKRAATAREQPSKRARSDSSSSSRSDNEDEQTRILLLESEIFESKRNYNNITILITLLRAHATDSSSAVVAAIALFRVFAKLIAAGDLTRRPDTLEKEAVVLQWLKERLAEYKAALVALLALEGPALVALTLALRLVKIDNSQLASGNEYSFPTNLLTSIVRQLLSAEVSVAVRLEFGTKFVEEYDDIRFYTFEAVAKVLGSASITDTVKFASVFEILTAIESVPESKDELEDFYLTAPAKKTHVLHSLTAHKKRAQEAWLALMRLPMDKEERKSLLQIMSTSIAPWFIKPELLMDFLTDCYNAGGSTSLQALSGVFYLIQARNLDYPLFYKKLYSLLDGGLLHSKHRSRFFRLLETFLGSTHLPAVLVASFIKRLARLALFAPPAAIVAIVPYIYNLLKRHPTCTFMIHREIREADLKSLIELEGAKDPFQADEQDPMITHANESSLWEITTLQSHYHPNVATLAKIISEQFTKQAYSLEDFLDHSYGSMLEAELSKEIKKVPVVEFEIPKKILCRQEAASATADSLLVKLWSFD